MTDCLVISPLSKEFIANDIIIMQLIPIGGVVVSTSHEVHYKHGWIKLLICNPWTFR
jgi:hypothetical protein